MGVPWVCFYWGYLKRLDGFSGSLYSICVLSLNLDGKTSIVWTGLFLTAADNNGFPVQVGIICLLLFPFYINCIDYHQYENSGEHQAKYRSVQQKGHETTQH